MGSWMLHAGEQLSLKVFQTRVSKKVYKSLCPYLIELSSLPVPRDWFLRAGSLS